MSREVSISRYLDRLFNTHISDIIIDYAKLNLWEISTNYPGSDDAYTLTFSKVFDKGPFVAFKWEEDSAIYGNEYTGDVLHLKDPEMFGPKGCVIWVKISKDQQDQVKSFLMKNGLLWESI